MRDHPAFRALDPDEEIHVQAHAGESVVVVTDRRLAVASPERLALNVPIDNVRRVQFDIERDRPATLVVVPSDRSTGRRSSRSGPRNMRRSLRPSS